MPVPTLDVSVFRNCSLLIPIDNDNAIYKVLPQATTACPVVHNASTSKHVNYDVKPGGGIESIVRQSSKEFVACSFSDNDVGTEVINPGYILKIEHIWQHAADDNSTDRHPLVRDDAVADRDCQEVVDIDMPTDHTI